MSTSIYVVLNCETEIPAEVDKSCPPQVYDIKRELIARVLVNDYLDCASTSDSFNTFPVKGIKHDDGDCILCALPQKEDTGEVMR